MSNSDNPYIGAKFEQDVRNWFNKDLGNKYILHGAIEIGNEKGNVRKVHNFDIVNFSEHIAIECKCYTWTKAGNVPSAKMGFTNEAAFYLTLLPSYYQKKIVMLKSSNSKKNETLAEYYYRINEYLLGDIQILEYDPDSNVMKCINTGKLL